MTSVQKSEAAKPGDVVLKRTPQGGNYVGKVLELKDGMVIVGWYGDFRRAHEERQPFPITKRTSHRVEEFDRSGMVVRRGAPIWRLQSCSSREASA